MKNQKGITLIALIITIIVMLILAGVAISTAIGDNGVIDKTQGAMREQERANVQDIIIASYVFEVIASTNNFAYIDIPKTGIAIYDNLKSNGFEVLGATTTVDENGNVVMTAPIKTGDSGEKIIDVKVEGNHGIYEGTVNPKGLDKDLEIRVEKNNATGENVGNTNSEEEPSVWGEYQGMLMYIGTNTELEITSSNLSVEEMELNENQNGLNNTGRTKKITFSDISMINLGNLEIIDFGDQLDKDIALYGYITGKIREIKGLEGITTFYNDAFAGCNDLEVIKFPSTLTTIETYAFQGTKLTEITIPASVTSIANNAFSGCSSLTKVTINKTKAEVEAEGGIGTEWIPSSVTEIIYLEENKNYTFTMQQVYALNPELRGDSSFYVSYEQFENLVGEGIENIREDYIIDIDGEEFIDNDTSNLQLVDSFINYLTEDSEGKYFIVMQVREEDNAIEFVMISNGNSGKYIKTTEQFLEFQNETKDIIVTLVEKDRIENLINGE